MGPLLRQRNLNSFRRVRSNNSKGRLFFGTSLQLLERILKMLANRGWHLAICVLQSLFLILPLPALAASSTKTGDLQRIQGLELAAFGSTSDAKPLIERIQALEIRLIGKKGNGTIQSRLEKLSQARNSKSLAKLTPRLDNPTAPILPPKSPETVHSFSGDTIDDDKVGGLLDRAMSAHAQGNVATAEKLLRQVLSLDKDNVDAHFNLGAIAEQKGDLQAALNNYRSAAQANPNDPQLEQAFISVQRKLEQREIAQQQERQMAKAKAEEDQKRNRLKTLANEAAQAYRNSNYDLAIRNLETISAQLPNDPDVQFGLAQAYRGKGNLQAASSHLSKARALDPLNQQYRDTLANVQNELAQAMAQSSPHNQERQERASSPYRPATRPYEDRLANSSSEGEIIPFVPSNDSSSALSGYVNEYGGPDGILPFAGGSAYSGGLTPGRRLSRAVAGSLAGAAIGAMMGRGAPGGIRGGAMRGALFGGMAGLIFGGY